MIAVCDACGADKPIELGIARQYTNNQPLHVCGNCGLVYVRERRSGEEIAKDWSDNLFGGHYTAVHPAIKARLLYVAETIAQQVGLKGKTLCDIGAGEGTFLEFVRNLGGVPFGTEHSPANITKMKAIGIECHQGSAESFAKASRKFDVVTMLWTLECATSPAELLAVAKSLLGETGRLVIGTSSRVLVPFKKLLSDYMVPVPADTHPLRPSRNSLARLLGRNGFTVTYENRWRDSDVLLLIAKPSAAVTTAGDDPAEVIEWFERWHRETQRLKPLLAAE